MKRIMYIDVEICPVCGALNKDFLLDGNYFYLCHCCGQFFRSFSDGREPIIGITFYPKTIRFNRQLNALRQNWYKLQELKIMKHHEYKFSKDDYDEVVDYSSDRKDVKTSPNPEIIYLNIMILLLNVRKKQSDFRWIYITRLKNSEWYSLLR